LGGSAQARTLSPPALLDQSDTTFADADLRRTPQQSPRSPPIKDNSTLADNSNDPVMQNQDVIQGARGIRRNPPR
jgi:hypothetical protein